MIIKIPALEGLTVQLTPGIQKPDKTPYVTITLIRDKEPIANATVRANNLVVGADAIRKCTLEKIKEIS
jgi:hypothetical protein